MPYVTENGKLRRIVVLALVGALTLGVGVAAAHRGPDPHRATYLLKEDLYGYPGTLRLIRCNANPDGRRRLWLVRDTGGVAVYTCRRP